MAESCVSLLLWLEKGKGRLTREQAREKGKDKSAAWAEALDKGWFTIDKDGMLSLSDAGAEELTLERMAA